MADKTGQELIKEAAEEPSVDQFMQQDPANMIDEDLDTLIGVLRRKRAEFIAKEKEKKG